MPKSSPFGRVSAAALLALSLAFAALPFAANTDAAAQTKRSTAKPAAAKLQRTAPVPRAQQAARNKLRDQLGRAGLVQTDKRTGGVRAAAKLDGFLTKPNRGARAAIIALDYVKQHRDAFGLSNEALSTLKLEDETRSNGITHLRWVQRIDGVSFIDGDLRASVTQDGRLLHITGGAHPSLTNVDTTPNVTREQAIDAAKGESASLVITTATGTPRLAWRVVRTTTTKAEDVLIDAHTQQQLRRTDRLSDAIGTAYRHYPGAPQGGSPETVQLDDWLLTAAPSDLTHGKQATVTADVNGNDTIDANEQIYAKPDGSFEHARYAWRNPFCPPAGCSWDPRLPYSYEVNQNHFGTQAFVSIHRFADHLAQPPIQFEGFTNNGRIDARVLVNAEGRNGGIPVNNASMFTPPAPQSPQMRMYLWKDTGQGYTSGHASDDASVVHHEHAHGFVQRTVTDAQGWGALTLRQSKALDEGLADVYALDFLVGEGLITDTPTPGEVRVAPFLDPKGKARTMPIDCPTTATTAPCKNGYTFKALGNVDPDGAEEHADGEVIAQTLWDLRTRLDDPQRFRLLLTEALRMVPIEPTFLDLRNAILLADTATGGTHRTAIWATFAQRGMGFYASTQDGNDVDPTENFDTPPTTGTATLRGTIRDRESGELLPGARVRLAGHETTDGALNGLRATTDENGRYEITNVPPGTYPGLTVARDGFETTVKDNVIIDGNGGTAGVTLRKNWAHFGWHSTITDAEGPDHTDEGCGPNAAIDGEPLTGWAVETAPERSFTLWLPEEVRLTSVAIVPRPGCGLGESALPETITVESSGNRGLVWNDVGTLQPAGKGMHDAHELRPTAPLENVRQLRITLRARTDQGPYLGLGDLRVFATTNVAPRASFSFTPSNPEVMDRIELDARSSTPGSHPIVAYRWDFHGDGRYDTPWQTTPDMTDIAGFPGRKTIALQIKDAAGETDTVRHTFWVGRSVEISDLGALDGNNASRAIFPTRNGTIAGSSHTGDAQAKQAARYRGGAWERLEPLQNTRRPAQRRLSVQRRGSDRRLLCALGDRRRARRAVDRHHPDRPRHVRRPPLPGDRHQRQRHDRRLRLRRAAATARLHQAPGRPVGGHPGARGHPRARAQTVDGDEDQRRRQRRRLPAVRELRLHGRRRVHLQEQHAHAAVVPGRQRRRAARHQRRLARGLVGDAGRHPRGPVDRHDPARPRHARRPQLLRAGPQRPHDRRVRRGRLRPPPRHQVGGRGAHGPQRPRPRHGLGAGGSRGHQ
jgi:extracellular elastinolytic metalloproteinase